MRVEMGGYHNAAGLGDIAGCRLRYPTSSAMHIVYILQEYHASPHHLVFICVENFMIFVMQNLNLGFYPEQNNATESHLCRGRTTSSIPISNPIQVQPAPWP